MGSFRYPTPPQRSKLHRALDALILFIFITDIVLTGKVHRKHTWNWADRRSLQELSFVPICSSQEPSPLSPIPFLFFRFPPSLPFSSSVLTKQAIEERTFLSGDR